MKIEYIIGENDYLQLLIQQLKVSDSKVSHKILFYIGNTVFSLFAIYYFITGTGSMRILFVLMAISLWMFGFFKRKFVRQRAVTVLERLKKKGVFENGYLGKHKLSSDGETLELEYGNSTQKIQLEDIMVSQYEDIKIIYAGTIPFEIVPASVCLDEILLRSSCCG